jgi:hypothetical protein
MRLGNMLSKPPKREFTEIEGFLVNKQGNVGQQVKLDVGQVALNYYCSRCEDNRTFISKGWLTGIFVSANIISMDCVLACGGGCDSMTQAWFLIESENDIRSLAPKVRILKRSEKLSDIVKINSERYGEFASLLELAERAYREDLGAGAIVYLRKILEQITVQTANVYNIPVPRSKSHGGIANFKKLLEDVDGQCAIIPKEFSKDGYRLFGELSDVVHGEYDEQLGLAKFEALHRLVIGILENIRNKEELQNAKISLGWE